MDAPAFREVPGYDSIATAAVFGRALAVAGGVDLMLSSLGRLPGTSVTAGRSGKFRSQRASVQIGQWRYSAELAGRLSVAHVVGGIVLGEDVLPPSTAGAHVAGAVGQHLADYGSQLLPDVLSLIEGLTVATA